MRVKIGIEQEFSVFPYPVPSSVLEKTDCIREYYPFQIEYNKILLDTSLENLEESFNKIIKILLRKSKEINKVYDESIDNKVYISEVPFYIGENNSLIFNGIHLHISFPNKNMDSLFNFYIEKGYNSILFWLIYKKYKLNPDLRFLFSHHIWGKYRYSEFNFKRKNKFRPIYISDKGTFELRIFSIFDFLYHRKEIIDIIRKFCYYITSFKKPRISYDIMKFIYINFIEKTVDYKKLSDLYNLLKLYKNDWNIKEDSIEISYPVIYCNGKKFRKNIEKINIPVKIDIEVNQEVSQYAEV